MRETSERECQVREKSKKKEEREEAVRRSSRGEQEKQKSEKEKSNSKKEAFASAKGTEKTKTCGQKKGEILFIFFPFGSAVTPLRSRSSFLLH